MVSDGETMTSTQTYEYVYAPNGYPASIMQKNDGDIFQLRVYTYDEKDRVTTIVKEYSKPYTRASGEVPYYAIINGENNVLYAKYKAEADKYPALHLLGRLAEYKYYNMDAIVGRALALADQLTGA